MGLNSEWKETGKELGGAFKSLAKTLIHTAEEGADRAEKWANENLSDEKGAAAGAPEGAEAMQPEEAAKQEGAPVGSTMERTEKKSVDSISFRMQICPSCGDQILVDAQSKYCSHCGKLL